MADTAHFKTNYQSWIIMIIMLPLVMALMITTTTTIMNYK